MRDRDGSAQKEAAEARGIVVACESDAPRHETLLDGRGFTAAAAWVAALPSKCRQISMWCSVPAEFAAACRLIARSDSGKKRNASCSSRCNQVVEPYRWRAGATNGCHGLRPMAVRFRIALLSDCEVEEFRSSVRWRPYSATQRPQPGGTGAGAGAPAPWCWRFASPRPRSGKPYSYRGATYRTGRSQS